MDLCHKTYVKFSNCNQYTDDKLQIVFSEQGISEVCMDIKRI